MAKTYALPDIHGRHDLLVKALERIQVEQAYDSAPHTIVFLGDYIDRGPASRQVLETLMAGAPPHSHANWVVLQGNHEAMMINAIRYGKSLNMWLTNGGNQALLSYGHPEGKFDPSYVPKETVDWLMTLPILHADEHRVYVHSCIDRNASLYEQRPNRVQWEDWSLGDEWDYNGLHIVHGHQPHEDGPKLYQGRTNLDTMAFKTSRLVVGVFDDNVAGGPVGSLEVRA